MQTHIDTATRGLVVPTAVVALVAAAVGLGLIMVAESGIPRDSGRAAAVAVIIVMAVGLGIALVVWLQRRVTGAVDNLLAATRAVSLHGDLSVRVPPAGSGELSRYCGSFNLMLSILEARQDELEAAVVHLRANEVRYRAIVRDAAEPLFRTRVDGYLLFANEAYFREYGRPEAAIPGRSFLDDVAAADCDRVRRQLAELREPGVCVRIDYRIAAADGAERWHRCVCRGIAGDHGLVTEIQCMSHDVTDVRRADQQRLTALDRLGRAQRLETIGTLASGIAHDLNNILTPITGALDMARLEFAEGSPVADQLDVALTSADRADELVQQILAFGSRNGGAMAPVPLQDTVAEALRLLRTSLPRPIEVGVELDPGCRPVLANGTQLLQVVLNLCTNGVHAIGDGPGRLEIRLDQIVIARLVPCPPGELAPGNYVRLAVSDDGIGIADADRERIFEPFYTTKPEGQGSGLGLSTVHAIVAAHGGRVDVVSQPGQGATFTILLPVAAANATAAE